MTWWFSRGKKKEGAGNGEGEMDTLGGFGGINVRWAYV